MEELPDLHWGDHRICKIGGESIMTMGDPPDRAYWWGMVFALGTTTSRRDRFVMLKSRGLIDLHRAIIDDLRPERIFQLGIFQGGSVVLVNELASPRKLVAIDLSDVRIDALDQYIEDRGLSGSVTAHYGVDQSDAGALRAILADQFEGQPLDLVIDDASHQLAPTRASFDVLFPHLRPGGVFLIEDWSTGIYEAEPSWLDEHLRGLGTPMANLVFELTLVCATRPDLIASIDLKPEAVAVRRGPEPIDVDDFALRDCFDHRWKQLLTETDYRSFT